MYGKQPKFSGGGGGGDHTENTQVWEASSAQMPGSALDLKYTKYSDTQPREPVSDTYPIQTGVKGNLKHKVMSFPDENNVAGNMYSRGQYDALS